MGNIDHLSTKGDVLAAISPKHKIIYMNESKKDLFMKKMGTMNFSKAHELGHWVLHVTKQRDYEQLSFDDSELFLCRGGSSRPPEEIQADIFAASLLMPKNIVTGAINQLKDQRQVTFPDLYKMTKDFEVSISALTRRVKDLGLLYFKGNQVYMNKEEITGQKSLW
jgi:Zn-dependent peptidase ImmA (M78 family)